MGDDRPDAPQNFPNIPENGPQEPAKGQLPGNRAGGQAGGIAQSQVAAADAKTQLDPGPEGGNHKRKVCKVGALLPGWPEEAIEKPQPRSQQAGQQEAAEIFCRGGHRNSRCQKPPALPLGSS